MGHWLRPLVWAVVLGCAGCPQPREAPAPSGAAPCDRHEDCNCGAECGALDACIDGYCEQGRSLLVPCRDDQTRRNADCSPPSRQP